MPEMRLLNNQYPSHFMRALWGALVLLFIAGRAFSAPYAAMVVDARTGEVLHSRNADTRLHPASLTKMMTLYIAFEALENGEITLDQKVKISPLAASEPPSKLGLKAGQYVSFRDLVRAAAIRSANDCATAIAEAISGSEFAFIQRMNATAKALGLQNTHFKNAHGLTEGGHFSTARDMTHLGRALFYHHPDYYNLFKRRAGETSLGVVYNTNRRLLDAFEGADGIKTGYTQKAGYNLVSSAKRGDVRIIATMFGGKSGAQRNARVAELLKMGFELAPVKDVVKNIPTKPAYLSEKNSYTHGFTGAVYTSPVPNIRPVRIAAKSEFRRDTPTTTFKISAPSEAVRGAQTLQTPQPRDSVILSNISGKTPWHITLGTYASREAAQSALIKSTLLELDALSDAIHTVQQNPRGYQAIFTNLSARDATRACEGLRLHGRDCSYIEAGSK